MLPTRLVRYRQRIKRSVPGKSRSRVPFRRGLSHSAESALSAGLATWGWRVIRTIGERITELTPSRGFTAEFSAALVILMASILPIGLPVSTTHTLVGAVLGVGLARGFGSLNSSVMKNIVASWIVTVPIGALLAIVFYYILKFLFIDFRIVGG